MREQSRDRHLMLVEAMVDARPPRRNALRARVAALLHGLMAPITGRRDEPPRRRRGNGSDPPRIRWEL